MPQTILDGSEAITDVFVHGYSSTQRWFVITDAGSLYACGSNNYSVCTGGTPSTSMTKTSFFKIQLLP